MLLHKKISLLVVHCSDTANSQNISAVDIHKMHLGFGWDGIGYHKVIKRSGKIENGRPEYWVGAHVKGKNDISLGVCLIGKNKFTKKQYVSLERILKKWKVEHPNAKIVGHKDTGNTNKTCPNFDVVGVNLNFMNIINSSACMKYYPSATSHLETECLFGETVEVLDQYLDWAYCKLLTDNYYGWIKKKNLGKRTKTTHRVIITRTFIFKESNPKSNILLYLPLGSQLIIENIHNGWAKTFFFIKKKRIDGYVPSYHIIQTNEKIYDWVKVAQSLEGTPYVWGGRDTIGLDCSALLQLSYQTYGQIIPRNTSDQVNLKKPNISEINNLRRGCVIFWEGHVGIMVDKKNCIHANAYHMKIVTEPLIDIINRMDKDHQIVKMMDFN